MIGKVIHCHDATYFERWLDAQKALQPHRVRVRHDHGWLLLDNNMQLTHYLMCGIQNCWIKVYPCDETGELVMDAKPQYKRHMSFKVDHSNKEDAMLNSELAEDVAMHEFKQYWRW